MTTFTDFTLAVVQAAPVYFDREASTEKACHLILQSGQKGADLIAFGETWLPGYPFFHTTSLWDKGCETYLANAVTIPSPTTDRISQAAQEAEVDVVIGMAELDPRTRGTTYSRCFSSVVKAKYWVVIANLNHLLGSELCGEKVMVLG
jgi:predicted amidohydrolase